MPSEAAPVRRRWAWMGRGASPGHRCFCAIGGSCTGWCGMQAAAVLKEERGSLALDDQVALLLQSLASDAAAVRATALQARAPSLLLALGVDGVRVSASVSRRCWCNRYHVQRRVDNACTVKVRLTAECLHSAKRMRCHDIQPLCFLMFKQVIPRSCVSNAFAGAARVPAPAGRPRVAGRPLGGQERGGPTGGAARAGRAAVRAARRASQVPADAGGAPLFPVTGPADAGGAPSFPVTGPADAGGAPYSLSQCLQTQEARPYSLSQSLFSQL